MVIFHIPFIPILMMINRLQLIQIKVVSSNQHLTFVLDKLIFICSFKLVQMLKSVDIQGLLPQYAMICRDLTKYHACLITRRPEVRVLSPQPIITDYRKMVCDFSFINNTLSISVKHNSYLNSFVNLTKIFCVALCNICKYTP